MGSTNLCIVAWDKGRSCSGRIFLEIGLDIGGIFPPYTVGLELNCSKSLRKKKLRIF